MNTQSKNKTWLIVIGMLLMANVVLFATYLLKRPQGRKPAERGRAMSNYLKNELGFSDAQMSAFDSIKNQHKQQAKQAFDAMRTSKVQALKDLGAASFSDSAIAKAAAFSASQQQEMEMHMLQHLKEIRGICTPEQRQKFDTGFYKVMARPREGKSKGDEQK